MSKYPIKFPEDTDLWKTNDNCSFCKTIDNIYQNIFKDYNNDVLNKECQRLLNYLDTYYLVNGYQLLLVYERNIKINSSNNIAQIKTYKTNTMAFMNEVYRQHDRDKFNVNVGGDPYKPTLIHGRWCQSCGARKPSIYDSERDI